jgi:hypothetical protein
LPPVDVTAKTEVNRAISKKQMDGFKLTIILHSDGVKIQRFNRNILPQSDELILLLENNDQHNSFGSVMYVKTGIGIRYMDFPLAEIFDAMSGTGVNISKKDLDGLLNPGILKSKLKVLTKTVNFLATVPNGLMSKALRFIADFSDKNFVENILKLTIEEKYWNPKAEGYVSKYFRKGTQDNVETAIRRGGTGVQNVDFIIKDAVKTLNTASKEFHKQMQQMTQSMPSKLRRMLLTQLKSVEDFVASVITFLQEESAQMAVFIARLGFEFANGYLCGIINGVVEGIAGLFEFINLILRAASALYKATQDIWESFIFVRETLENVIEAFNAHQLFDYILLIVNAPYTIMKAISKANLVDIVSKLKDINIAKVGYLLGYIVGIIAEMLLEVFVTGGAAAVAKAIEFIQNFAKGSVKFIRKSGTRLEEEIATLSTRLSHLFQSLRDKTAIPQLQKWIDDIILEIKKALG